MKVLLKRVLTMKIQIISHISGIKFYKLILSRQIFSNYEDPPRKENEVSPSPNPHLNVNNSVYMKSYGNCK